MGTRRTLDGADAAAGPVVVRPATADDVVRLAKFAAHAFRSTYGPEADPAAGGGSRAEDVAAYVDAHFGPAHLAADLADPGLATVVADAHGELAGYAQLRLPPALGGPDAAAPPAAGARPAELARLYVDRAWQGRGVAVALLDAVSARAAEAGATGLWLAVYQRNGRAAAFYRRQGFTVAGAGTFRMGDELQHDWVMVR